VRERYSSIVNNANSGHARKSDLDDGTKRRRADDSSIVIVIINNNKRSPW
jgi:hypothetical protein